MSVYARRWPGGRWIADRSQQGLTGKHLTLGPLQFNWYTGFRLYITWPVPVVVGVERNER